MPSPGVLRFGEALVARLAPRRRSPLSAFADLFQDRRVGTSALQWDPERPSRTVLVQRRPGGALVTLRAGAIDPQPTILSRRSRS